MMNITILFRSKKGTTNAFAREIGYYLQQKGNNVTIKSIDDYREELVQNADIIFLGCWTQGMFLMFQHPDREWKQFVKHLPPMKTQKIVLFTTYKIYTGKMFRSMQYHLKNKVSNIAAVLKSRNNSLSEMNKQILDTLLN